MTDRWFADVCDQIRDRLDARAVADRYGLTYNRGGFARCPIHGENTPSLKLYDGRRGWYCFGCHAGGDVVALAAALLHCSPVDAARQLDADFDLGLMDRQLTADERAAAARAAAQRERAAALAAQLDEWRTARLNANDLRIQTANTLPDNPDEWTRSQLDALRKREYLEYESDLLENGDTATHLEMMIAEKQRAVKA